MKKNPSRFNLCFSADQTEQKAAEILNRVPARGRSGFVAEAIILSQDKQLQAQLIARMVAAELQGVHIAEKCELEIKHDKTNNKKSALDRGLMKSMRMLGGG